MIYTTPVLPDELYHHGIKGQKWGVRRYQNEDGTYTKAGLRRRRKEVAKEYIREIKDGKRVFGFGEDYKQAARQAAYLHVNKGMDREEAYSKAIDQQHKWNKALTIAGVAALTAFGAMRVSDIIKEKRYTEARDKAVDIVNSILKQDAKIKANIKAIEENEGFLKSRYGKYWESYNTNSTTNMAIPKNSRRYGYTESTLDTIRKSAEKDYLTKNYTNYHNSMDDYYINQILESKKRKKGK